MLFSEEELDAAAAQRARADARLLVGAAAQGADGGASGGARQMAATAAAARRATRRWIPSSATKERWRRCASTARSSPRARQAHPQQIDGAQLPHALHADGDTLLAAIAALVSLALRTLRGSGAHRRRRRHRQGLRAHALPEAAADCQKGAGAPVLDAAKAYGVAIDADEARAPRARSPARAADGGAGRRRRRGLDALKGDWCSFDVGGVREKSAGRGIHS